jgi:hypothetical protein
MLPFYRGAVAPDARQPMEPRRHKRYFATMMILRARLSLSILLLASVCIAAQGSTPSTESMGSEQSVEVSGLYLKVRLDAPLKASKLRPGDQVSGKLFQDVYSGAAQVFPASSEVRLTVDRLDRRRRVPNDHWPWVIKAFTPRHERYPAFRVASVMKPDGSQSSLEVSLIAVSQEVEVEPKAKKNSSSSAPEVVLPHRARRDLGPLVTLIASTQVNTNGSVASAPTESVTIPSGTEAKVILLGDLSASGSHASDNFQARLVEPVFRDSRILLPEGTLFEGKVLRSQAPRTLSRSGSILLAFTNVTIPGGTSAPVAASIAGAQINQRSHTVIDPEGRMHGDRPGKAWMLMNIGVTAGIAKEVDDGTQLVIETIVSTATDVSTAGTARIVSACASTIFLLTRHGRDVVLPKYTQMKIVFDRPVKISHQTGPALGD